MSSPHGHPLTQQQQQQQQQQSYQQYSQSPRPYSQSPHQHSSSPHQFPQSLHRQSVSPPVAQAFGTSPRTHSHPTPGYSPHLAQRQLPPHFESDGYTDADNPPYHNQYGYQQGMEQQQQQQYPYGGGGPNDVEEELGPAMMHRQYSQPQHPAFVPIFTLIEDSTSQEHFHPKVHYIFSDDVDTPLDIALGNRAARHSDTNTENQTERDDSNDDADDSNTSQQHKRRHQRRRKAQKQQQGRQPSADDSLDLDAAGWPKHIRPIIVTMAPDLTHAQSAYSLSPDWQLTNVQIGKAPQWLVGDEFPGSGVGASVTSTAGGSGAVGLGLGGMGGMGGNSAGGPGAGGMGGGGQGMVPEGLMLTIEGTSIPHFPELKKDNTGMPTTTPGEGLYDLANTFADRMALIKRIVEFSQLQEYEQEREIQAMEQRRLEMEQQLQQMQLGDGGQQQVQDGDGGTGGEEENQRRSEEQQGQQTQEDSEQGKQFAKMMRLMHNGVGQVLAEHCGQGDEQEFRR